MSAVPRVYSYSRWSTPEQSTGDSKRRQTALAEEWAASRGLILDATLSRSDQGISAFKNDNVHTGALGQFLHEVKSGKVKQGSYLLVESLDRISRDEILKALNVFISIIESGITLVTLADRKEYNYASVTANPMDLMFSLLILMRAHEESLTKSKRIKANYENRRKNPKGKIISNRFPFWLKANETRTGFITLPEKVKLVKRIFSMCIKGHSKNNITKVFNKEQVPTIRNGSAGGWHKSAIHKILESRAVIGEFTPCTMVKGKQVSTNDTLKNYFPAILPEEVFYKAQAAIKERLRKPNKHKEGVLNNIFSYVVKCGYCGGSMIYAYQGRGFPYLVCNGARRGHRCEFRTYRYREFEAVFLRIIKEVNLDCLSESDRQQEVLDAIMVNKEKTSDIETKQAKLTEAIMVAPNVGALSAKLGQLEQERLGLVKEKHRLEIELNANAKDANNSLRDMVTTMKNLTGDDLYKFRVELRQRIRDVVKMIKAYIGAPPLKVGKNNEIAVNDKKPTDEERRSRVCGVVFKSGGVVLFKHAHGNTDAHVTVRDKDGAIREECVLTN